jgi:glycosyltransferase involved in cell wall biosynthesis
MSGLIRHLVTSEYPPQTGGVSDYTHLVANGLAAAGDEVHVWCPSVGVRTACGSGRVKSESSAVENQATNATRVVVHRELGRMSPADLRRVSQLLDQFPAPRRILMQWVPHGYGYRSMNLAFCLWLWSRAKRHRDQIEVMVHEPYLPFNGSMKQNGVAFVHRLMTIVLLQAARRVWMSIPAWEPRWRPYALGRRVPFTWLPVASNIPVIEDPLRAQEIRARYGATSGLLLGHFGAYDRNITALLLDSVPLLLRQRARESMLFVGRGSQTMRESLVRRYPELSARVHATGDLSAIDLSLHLAACDVMLQPFIDGVSSRRTSIMVALAHGLPIMTTSGELTESLWAQEQAVALAPVMNNAAFVDGTQRLLADDAGRNRLGRAARVLYSERFNAQHIIAKLRAAAA